MGNEQEMVLLTDKQDTKSSNSLKMIESIETPTGEYTNGVLCTLEGPLSDFSKPTRNNRIYEKDLWVNVLNSNYFNEMMETNTLFGEPDHPMEVQNRDEVHLPYVSHAIRDVRIDGSKEHVVGKLDVLDTPYGRIIKTLVDYGAVLGVSSRGNGEIINTSQGPTVNASTYRFITWDIVSYPSNDTARQKKVTESKEPASLYESMRLQVDKLLDDNSSKTESLKLTRSLVENSGVPGKDDLVRYINESLVTVEDEDEDDDLDEIDSIDTFDETDEKSDDLQDALNRILELRDEITRLKAREEELIELMDTHDDTIAEKNDKIDKLTHRVSELMDNLSDVIIGRDTDSTDIVISLDDTDLVQDISESVKGEFTKNLNKSLGDVVDALALHVINESESLETSITKLFTKKLRESSLSQTASTQLKEELAQVKSENKEILEENSILVEKVNLSKKVVPSVENDKLRDAYISTRCNQLGVDRQLLESKLVGSRNSYDPDVIDSIARTLYKSDARNSRGNDTLRINESSDQNLQVVHKLTENNESDNDITSIIRQMNKHVR